MKSKTGFTLIELLIVIAIIAILALIAVPNFLEAQIRAKVTRCMADMKSYATAIEAYAVDWGSHPLDYFDVKDPLVVGNVNPILDAMSHNERNIICLSVLTTPVSYIGRLPRDPFAHDTEAINARIPYYEMFTGAKGQGDEARLFNAGFQWAIQSKGPSKSAIRQSFLRYMNGKYDTGQPPYDSSNGTISVGIVIRTNKGGWSDPRPVREL